MSKPFTFLFEGNDFLKSRAALDAWVFKFRAKYGDLSHHVIHADEMSIDEAIRQLEVILHEQSLFSQHRLIQIMRAQKFDASSRSTAASQKVFQQLQKMRSRAQDTTVLLYCDLQLSDSHPYRKMVDEHDWAKQYYHDTPVVRVLIKEELARAGLRELDHALMVQLDQQLHALHQLQRSQLRLKSTESIPQDQCRGWVRSVCQNIAVLGESHRDLAQVIGDQFLFTSPFAFVNAIQAQQFVRARECVQSLASDADFTLFMIMSLLSRARIDQGFAYQRAVRRLSAEAEIFTKNGIKDHGALLQRFVDVLDQFVRTGTLDSLVSPRKMWLASL